jgi:hypothetical protein
VPTSTAEHPASLLAAGDGRFTKQSRLLIVTSHGHSRRTLLAFKKQGYTNVRIVSAYRSAGPRGPAAREIKVSTFAGFQPSTKSYENVFSRVRDGSTRLVNTIQELTAIAWYWWKGLI